MALTVKHRFISGKTDGPDASQIQPSNWNDGHTFVGGAAGDVLTRDPIDPAYGAIWQAPGLTTTTALNSATVPATIRDHVVILTGGGDFHGVAPDIGTFAVGTRVTIKNRGATTITLLHDSSAMAVAARLRNIVASQRATLLAPLVGSAVYVWDGTSWHLTAHEQGTYLPSAVQFSNISASVAVQQFYVRGASAHIRLYLAPATIGGAMAAVLIIGWPFVLASQAFVTTGLGSLFSGSGWGPTIVTPGNHAGGNGLSIAPNTGQWAAGSVYMSADLTVPIS